MKDIVAMIKQIVSAGSLCYLTLIIPIVLILYFSWWYRVSFHFHDRIQIVGVEKAIQGIEELKGFFRHSNALNMSRWTPKEKNHMAEVRQIMDCLFITMLIAFPTLIFTAKKEKIAGYALVNIGIILLFLLVIPFFSYFWRHIFHPLLFNNHNWLNTPLDFSFYILPRVFFQYTVGYVIGASSLLNLLIWGYFKRLNLKKQPKGARR